MKRKLFISGVILLANMLLAVSMYLTGGRYFIRGYDEVSNGMVVGVVVALGVLNLLAVALIACIPRWRRSFGGRAAMCGLTASAALTLLSPLYAPLIGGVAKRSLWIETPLIEAARYGDAELVIMLLNHGADPNARQPGSGTTALHHMAYRGDIETVKTLLAHGADLHALTDYENETPLDWAGRGSRDVRVMRLLRFRERHSIPENDHARTE